MSKLIKLTDLKIKYENCTACALGVQRQSRNAEIVFGEGNLDAKIFVIGESPGPQEEREKMPLYPGADAGEIFAKFLNYINVDRSEIYITNAMICAPLSDRGTVMYAPDKAKHFGSVSKKIGALYACNQRLLETIDIVKPSVIVLLGSVAYSALFGSEPKTVTSALGKHAWNGYNCYLTYHPSFYARKKNSPETQKEELVELTVLLKKHWDEIKSLSLLKREEKTESNIKEILKISKILKETTNVS